MTPLVLCEGRVRVERRGTIEVGPRYRRVERSRTGKTRAIRTRHPRRVLGSGTYA